MRHAEQGLPAAFWLPKLDQLVDLRIVSSHHKDWEDDTQETVDDRPVDEAVV